MQLSKRKLCLLPGQNKLFADFSGSCCPSENELSGEKK
jgi:hypothetical protein